MLVSALIFGYFGFLGTGGSWTTPDGTIVPAWLLLDLTLKATAICFAVSAGLYMAAPLLANMAYCLVSMGSALMFILVAILDWIDPDHAAAAGPVLLLIFAAWNGYGAISSLQSLLNRSS